MIGIKKGKDQLLHLLYLIEQCAKVKKIKPIVAFRLEDLWLFKCFQLHDRDVKVNEKKCFPKE